MTKSELMNEILHCSPVHRVVNNEQFRIRCPICGDSKKNPNDCHCYIKCSNDITEPILYNCFLCNSSGRVNKWFMEKLEADTRIIDEVQEKRYNHIQTIQNGDSKLMTGNVNMNSRQVKYITKRLGSGFTEEDYARFKIVWTFDPIYRHVNDRKIRNTLPNNHNSISFLSDDKTAVFTRSFNEEGHRWRKIRLSNSDHHSYYFIQTTIDLFTKDDIVVNIAEGVFDILSVYKNFNDGPKSIFMAALGSDYIGALDYVIMKGFIGSNVIIKIYIDNGINESTLYERLAQYKWLFKAIFTYKNMREKDVGVNRDMIKLEEKRV